MNRKKPIFVQVKWPENPNKELSASRYGLDSMVTEAMNRCVELGIDPYTDSKPNFEIDVVTYGKSLKRYTAETKFRHIPVRTIGHKALDLYFKNNKPFWNQAYELISQTQPTVGNKGVVHTCQTQDNYWPELFKDTKSIDEYNRKHKKILKTLEVENELALKTYDVPHRIGDSGEIFTYVMYRLSETNIKFNVSEYKQTVSDNGLDGEGWRYL